MLVLLAALLSMLIGIEREIQGQPAGMRTHMLVGIGSCLFTILSSVGFPGGDPSRVASNIVTGIGFLGAGTILHRSGSVKNLTTAASIWATAAVGMAIGVRAWLVASGVTLMMLVTLYVLQRLEIRFLKRREKQADEKANRSAGEQRESGQ